MRINRFKPSATIAVAVIALVVGLEAPAVAHQVKSVAHKISGSSIKPNTVTGKQVKESTLGKVPKAKHADSATTATTATRATTAGTATNATELAGKPASAYALAGGAFNTGTVTIPNNGADPTTVLSLGAVTWKMFCFSSGTNVQAEMLTDPTGSAWIGRGPDEEGNSGTGELVTSSTGQEFAIGANAPSGTSVANSRSFIVDGAEGGLSYHGTLTLDANVQVPGGCTVQISGS